MVVRAFVVILLLIIVKLSNTSDSLFDEELYKRILNNETCEQHLQEINVMQFYDASGRVPQSITLGGQGSLGNYRQCLALAQKLPNDTINGKYCIVHIPLDTRQNVPTVNDLNGLVSDIRKVGNATEIEESMLFKRALRVIVGDGNMRNHGVAPLNQILLALRFYALGTTLLSVADFVGVSKTSASRIIHDVSKAIAGLYSKYIKIMPQQSTCYGFFRIAKFPRVFGAVDCTHIKVHSPCSEIGEEFRNRKGYFSVNVQAVCTADLLFINMVARWPGSAHDATIFNSSELRAQCESGLFGDTWLLGDSAYPLKPYLLTPLLAPVTTGEIIYNEGHIKTRNCIERAIPSTESRSSVKVALCIPDSCTTEEAIGRFTDLLNVTYQEDYCRLPNDKVFSAVDYVAVATIVILGTLTILSTGYDMYNSFVLQKDAAEISKLLTCCSIYTNTHRLLSFKTPGSIDCMDGIRALSILWVVIGHSFSNIFLSTIANLLTAYQWAISLDAIWLLSAVLSVDTFFMMSGLLVVYTTAKKMTPRSLLQNIHWFYLHRLLRMFPLLGAAVLFQASLVHHAGDGPNWPELASSVQACRKWWWSALLHVQNYANMTEICLAQTWYLAVDTQLHILSPLVLFWVLGSRRSAWSALTVGLLASLISTTVYCYVKSFSGLSMLNAGTDVTQIIVYFKQYYVNTLTRSPAFVVGMVFGYLLHVWREHPRRISKWFITTGWLAAIALGSGMIYFNYPGVKMTQFWRNFLNAFMRPLWALSVGWVVFACSSGYGGPVNWFLSWTMWKFLARVSYALYLIHYPLQAVVRAQGEMPVMFSVTAVLYTFYTDLALSLMAATLLCIVVDAPFSTLQKIFMAGKSKSAQPPSNGVSPSTQNLVA